MEQEKPRGVAVAVTSRMCRRTADAFPPLILLLDPVPFSSWPHPLGLLPSHPPTASPPVSVSSPLWQLSTQPSKPPPPCLSHCWLWQHQLGAHTNKPSKAPYLGFLPPLTLPSAVSAPHWSFAEISVFLIYCKTKERGPKSQLLTIAAALLTFSGTEGGLSVY